LPCKDKVGGTNVDEVDNVEGTSEVKITGLSEEVALTNEVGGPNEEVTLKDAMAVTPDTRLTREPSTTTAQP